MKKHPTEPMLHPKDMKIFRAVLIKGGKPPDSIGMADSAQH